MTLPRALTLSSLSLLLVAAACGGGGGPVLTPEPALPELPIGPTPPPPPPRAPSPRKWNAVDSASVRVPILIATTRRAVQAERPGFRFGTVDADQLSWSYSTVNVPSYRNRESGAINRVSGARVMGVPEREMYLTSLIPADRQRFVQRVREDLARTRSRDVLVFVHGYNSSFEDAALRLAQLVVDMGFDGTAVLFSWPSAGSLTGYVRDQQAARNAGFHLLDLLKNQLAMTEADRIHLVAHSMGSEVVAKAMSLAGTTDSLPRLAQIAFAAPDVDTRVFAREVLPVLRARATRVTLYASSEDDALRASRSVNNVWRLGLGGDSVTVLDGMDTIDASRVRGDILGHTLFGSDAFLTDLHALLSEGRGPETRRLLAVRRADGRTLWRFRSDGR